MDDINIVLDALEVERATLFGVAESANVCALYAATYPDRCERLALFRPYARSVRTETYPYGSSEEEWLASIRTMRERFGDIDLFIEWARAIDPAILEDGEEFENFVWMHRLSVSPSAAADFARMQMDTDVTDVLGSIRVPTAILCRTAGRDPARYVAERIPGAEFIEFGGQSFSPYSADVADTLLAFVQGESRPAIPDSVLATVLFTDLVGSTERAAALGDRRWSELLERHHEAVRRELVRFRGTEVDSAGDGFFCRFDGPARAIACARSIIEGAKTLELVVRAGVHTGECELVGGKIAGIAVVTGARISSSAGVGEVLVSSTVKDLVAGSGLEFADRGERELKGVPGLWRLYSVVDA
jgi:class 3 adenylate cyclase